MSIRFSGGERFQRGRGIGGLLRLAKGLFKPAIQTIGRAVKSNTGKAVGRALKKQAISTWTNLLADIVAGNNLKEGIDREVGDIRQNTALGIKQLTNNNNNPYESEIETSKEIQSKRKNQTKNKKQTKKKNQPPKKGGKKKGDNFVFV